MRINLTLFLLLSVTNSFFAQWQPAGDKIKTRWASQIDMDNVLPEYPRPIMERDEWQNLNGLWNYIILPIGKQKPTSSDEHILVPFAIESSLSGVRKRVGANKELVVQPEIYGAIDMENNKILLHFGAVDWKADVWVNGVKVSILGDIPPSLSILPSP